MRYKQKVRPLIDDRQRHWDYSLGWSLDGVFNMTSASVKSMIIGSVKPSSTMESISAVSLAILIALVKGHRHQVELISV
jgi:hypothetical protein